MAISLRGTSQTGTRINGNDVTLTFDVATPPLTDHLVIVFGGHGVTETTLADPGSGYTQIAIHTGTAPIFGAWYKKMGATPDTSVVCNGGGNVDDAVAYGCVTYSGVDTITPLDQTTVTVGPTASTNPNCGSITTQTVNAFVLAFAGSDIRDLAPGTVADYTDQLNEQRNDTEDFTTAFARIDAGAIGAEDPAAWGAWATSTWYAITAALRPAEEIETPIVGIVFSGSWDRIG